MKKPSRHNLGEAVGYCVLDVKCVSIDDDAAHNESLGLDAAVPSFTTVQLPPAQPNVATSVRSVRRRRSMRLRYSELTAAQIAAVRRKRFSRLVRFLREERIPLLCALTGIAMSTLLAMLFSMLDPRAAMLGIRDGNAMQRTSTEERTSVATSSSQEDRETLITGVPNELPT